MNIADKLTEHARTHPNYPAIEDGKRIVTYAELDSHVNRSAANLQLAGIGAGDTVAVMLPDSADHLIILYALVRSGTVIFSLNTLLPKDEIERSLSSVSLKAAIVRTRAAHVSGLKPLTIKDICRPALESFGTLDIDDDHPLALIQSSGTTGAPKSFFRNHVQMREWIRRYARNQGWIPTDRCLSLTPMSFNVGRNISLGMLHVGATVVINRARTLEQLVASVRDRRITYLKLTPAHLRSLLDYAEGKALLFPGLRAMVVGSAPVTHKERILARKWLTPNFLEQLGSNEAGLLTIATPADQDAYPDAVGRVVEGVEAQIVDAEDMPVSTGEVGLVRFRGSGFPTSYLNDPEATASAFRDGWFYPGDLAALNDEGYLFFKGRADDVINNEGAKFYPIEVENALLAHPEVTEAAAFGWPHKRHGEVAVAIVVTKSALTDKDLAAFCAQRIPRYKIPQIIKFVSEMPKNSMGKILKVKLKNSLRQNLSNRSL